MSAAQGRTFLDDAAQEMGLTIPKVTTNITNLNSFAQLQCAGNVQPQPINWLWPNRIALGKLTMIAGDPGLGKSLLSIELAKHVTKGIRWPVDDTPCPTGDVILLSAEDDLADTIRPRLDAAGANPNKVYILESINDIDQKSGEVIKRSFSLKRDVAAIEQTLEQNPQIRLIIVDPISAYLGGTDSHNNSDIRSVLSPLSELANKKKVAIVVITHLNKGSGQGSAMYRATGSLAFVAAARAVFIVTRDQDDPERRLFLPIKNNLGTDREGFAYRVTQADNGAPIIEWEDETITISADDALAVLSNEDKTERQDAISFLEKENYLKVQMLAGSQNVLFTEQRANLGWSRIKRTLPENGLGDFLRKTYPKGATTKVATPVTQHWQPSLKAP